MAAAGVPDVKDGCWRATRPGTSTPGPPGWLQPAPLLERRDRRVTPPGSSTTASMSCMPSATTTGRSTSRPRTTGLGARCFEPTVPRPVNLRVDPLEQHMDAPSYPIYVGEKLWDGPSRRGHRPAARGHLHRVPTAAGTGWVQPPRAGRVGAARRRPAARQLTGRGACSRCNTASCLRRAPRAPLAYGVEPSCIACMFFTMTASAVRSSSLGLNHTNSVPGSCCTGT